MNYSDEKLVAAAAATLGRRCEQARVFHDAIDRFFVANRDGRPCYLGTGSFSCCRKTAGELIAAAIQAGIFITEKVRAGLRVLVGVDWDRLRALARGQPEDARCVKNSQQIRDEISLALQPEEISLAVPSEKLEPTPRVTFSLPEGPKKPRWRCHCCDCENLEGSMSCWRCGAKGGEGRGWGSEAEEDQAARLERMLEAASDRLRARGAPRLVAERKRGGLQRLFRRLMRWQS